MDQLVASYGTVPQTSYFIAPENGRASTVSIAGRSLCQALGVVLLVLACACGWAQEPMGHGQVPRFGVPSSRGNTSTAEEPLNDASGTADQRELRMLNAARQKSIVSDTDKLLRLASQLDAEIAASNSGVLTQEQLRKVAQIEKLARRVRENMSIPPQTDPAFQGVYSAAAR